MNNQIKAIRDASYLFSVHSTLNLDNVTSMLFRFSFEITLPATAVNIALMLGGLGSGTKNHPALSPVKVPRFPHRPNTT
jgi:hypothetical protein